MGFMRPFVGGPEVVYRVECKDGSSYTLPSSVSGIYAMIPEEGDTTEDLDTVEDADQYRPEGNGPAAEVVHAGTGYVARMSAPGYMDCSDWRGPFASLQDAMTSLAEDYDLCTACGGDLDGCYRCPDCDQSGEEEEE